MGSLTHKAARTAAGIGIDQALKKVTRGDREAELLKLIDSILPPFNLMELMASQNIQH